MCPTNKITQYKQVKHTSHKRFKGLYQHQWSYGGIQTVDYRRAWWRCSPFDCLCGWIQDTQLFLPVRTYVFHLLRIYIILLCNWLILWQNALYLYLGKSRMCLILQETCCSSLILKPWRLDQEISEEKLFIKAGQIARHLQTDSSTAAQHLSTPVDR